MNVAVPTYLFPYILIGNVAVLSAVLSGMYNALKRAGWPAEERRQAFGSVTALLVAFFLAALWPSWAGFYHKPFGGLPTIQYGLLIPIIAGVALFRLWPTLRRVIDAVPQEWLVSVQFYRAIGVIFLILYAGGHLPAVFAWPAGTGDVLVGLLAPFVGMAYARKSRNAEARVRAWNLLGITDLVVAVSTGFLTSPSPLQMFAFDRPNELIGMFPLVMIPVFAVPLSILLHLASLQKLRSAETLVPAFAANKRS